MRVLNILAVSVATLLVLGEVARFWGNARFIPMALDELILAGLLLWAASRAPQHGARWHVVAWSSVSALMLVLLVETADHQIHGPVKEAGNLYLVALSTMLILGLLALRRALRCVAAPVSG